MSADNYGIVHPYKDGWGLTMGFASCDYPDLDDPYFTAPTLEEVESYAMTEYFEYGWSHYEGYSLSDKISFFPTFLCENGHRTAFGKKWLKGLEDGRACDFPVFNPEGKIAFVEGEELKALESEGRVVRCGAEFEDVQLFIGDFKKLLGVIDAPQEGK